MLLRKYESTATREEGFKRIIKFANHFVGYDEFQMNLEGGGNV